jgi:hypothetical protein
MKLITTVLALCISLSCFGATEIQKWVDKDGKVHYGDRANSPALPSAPLQKRTDASMPQKAKPMNEQTWNKAVERAENAPTGAGGRHLGKFADEDPRVHSPSSSDPSYGRRGASPPSHSGSFGPSPYEALRQVEAERQYSAHRKQQELAQKERTRQLIAECERQRTSNCQDPNTLRYIENSNKPRGAYR